MSMRQRLIVLVVAALLVASCGNTVKEKAAEAKAKVTETKERATEKILEKLIEKKTGEKVKVNVSKGRINIKGEKGEVTFTRDGDGEAPEDFPKDVYIYEDAGIVMSATQLTTFSLVLRTPDDFEKVMDTYREKMTSLEWEEVAADNTSGVLMLQYKKANRSAMVRRIDRKDEKTQVLLIVKEEEE